MARGLPDEEVVRRIKKALARDGTHTWDHICDLIAVNALQVFHDPHGCWITEIISTPIAKWLHVWIVAGELPEVMSLQPQVLAFAKEQGCTRMTATARLGWKHVAKAHGWINHSMLIAHPL